MRLKKIYEVHHLYPVVPAAGKLKGLQLPPFNPTDDGA
jgi:hypothetical protein